MYVNKNNLCENRLHKSVTHRTKWFAVITLLFLIFATFLSVFGQSKTLCIFVWKICYTYSWCWDKSFRDLKEEWLINVSLRQFVIQKWHFSQSLKCMEQFHALEFTHKTLVRAIRRTDTAQQLQQRDKLLLLCSNSNPAVQVIPLISFNWFLLNR